MLNNCGEIKTENEGFEYTYEKTIDLDIIFKLKKQLENIILNIKLHNSLKCKKLDNNDKNKI